MDLPNAGDDAGFTSPIPRFDHEDAGLFEELLRLSKLSQAHVTAPHSSQNASFGSTIARSTDVLNGSFVPHESLLKLVVRLIEDSDIRQGSSPLDRGRD